ncbi:MAG: hypothetical protein LBR27_00055 [Bifidobacteriaceae bacterium]|nr:hypothetical protein [Bifidobacteriaceae bacterium]
MFWFLLWTGLILAWAVGVFFGLRWLWRRFRAFMDAFAGLGEAMAVFDDGTERFHAAPIPRPLPSLDEALARRRGVQATRRAKRATKRARNQQRYDEWLALAGWGEV